MTQARYEVPPDLRLEPLGETWVAYSPLSGETMVLNNESAAILEVLRERPGDLASVCVALSADVGLAPAELATSIGPSWSQIVDAGLIAESTHTA